MEREGNFLTGKREMGRWKVNLLVYVISLFFYSNLIAQPAVTSGPISIWGTGQDVVFRNGDVLTTQWNDSATRDDNTTPANNVIDLNGEFAYDAETTDNPNLGRLNSGSDNSLIKLKDIEIDGTAPS